MYFEYVFLCCFFASVGFLVFKFYTIHTESEYKPHYKINYDLDRLLRQVIDDRDNVRVIKNDGYYLTFEYQSRFFSVWVGNKFYGYLSKFEEHKGEDRNYNLVRMICDCQPTEQTIKDFYHFIDEGKTPSSEWLRLDKPNTN